MNRSSPHPYSFQKRVRHFFYLLYFLLIGILSCYTFYTIHVLQRNAETMQRQSLRLFCSQVQSSLRDSETYLTNLNTYSLDLSVVAAHSSQSNVYGNIVNVSRLLQQSALSFSMVDGLYAYFPRNQVFISSPGSVSDSSSLFPVQLRTRFREDKNFVSALQTSGSRWFPVYSEGHWYFVLLCTLNDSYVGAFIDSASLTDWLEEAGGSGAIAFFTDHDGNTVCVNGQSEAEDNPANEGTIDDGGQILPARVTLSRTLTGSQAILVDGTKYLVQSEPTGFSNLNLTIMTPYSQVTGNLMMALKLLLFLFLLSIIVFFAATHWSLQLVTKPLNLLHGTAAAISAGEVHRRIDTSSLREVEFREIAATFNSMLDTIEQLRINVYEQELEKRTLELNLLKSQVSPHFFINCLGLIDLMADGTEEHSRIIHQMIARLSKHLRYTLRARDRVSLAEELEYEENYIEMTKLRFPGCLSVTFDIAPEAKSAEIFPILLLNFTENAFKVNLVMGEQLSLTIRARVEIRNGEKRLHLTHIDSGEGFDDEFLAKYSQVRKQSAESWAEQLEGYRIGNWNLLRHLTLIYGSSASLLFSNEPGSGARVDIDIPFREYCPDEVKS